MFLAEKNITIDVVEHDLMGAENCAMPIGKNPGGQMPALELDDVVQLSQKQL